MNAGDEVGVKLEAPFAVERIPRIVLGPPLAVTVADADVPVPEEKLPTASMGVVVSTPENAARTAVASAADVPDPAAVFTVTVSGPAEASMA